MARTTAFSLNLFTHHRKMLADAAISDEVIKARGYQTIGRPTNGDDRSRQRLKRLGISSKITKVDTAFPGLLIPLYRATGEQLGAAYRPDKPPKDDKGKPRKYVMPAGRPPVLDVHPFNRDRIIDPTVPLWITEGVKKGDALTTARACVVTLAGVFNWRSQLATLGDWEDIPLPGRKVFICFDADAATNPNVAKAMKRLGQWLRSKGAEPKYVVVPGRPEDKTGADDFLAAGGTLEDLIEAATTQPPEVAAAKFTDAEVAGELAGELDGQYHWTSGLGWMRWDGRRWARTPDPDVHERARRWVMAQHADACDRAKESPSASSADLIKAWQGYLSRSRLEAIVSLARGIMLVDAADFDAHPDLLNVGNGVVDLRTGELLAHDPRLLMTKLTTTAYDPGAEHPDWKAALEAVPADILDWYQVRLGQAVSGYMTPDDVMLVQVGSGENGKSTVTAAIQRAVGEYFHSVPHRALLADASAIPTEVASFRGVRLAVLEETPEERRLSVNRLKQLVGTPQITARHVYQQDMTFDATHSLIINTNYAPSVAETDHGTWRRLALVRFPYRWVKPGEELHGDDDREGDPGLRDRLREGRDGQHEAILAWLVAGAVRCYEADRVMPPKPDRVEQDTREWRAESDLVMAFWDEELIADPGSNIPVADMLAEFNQFLGQRGHRPWTDKTLTTRLGDHEITAASHVVKDRTRDHKNASRTDHGYEPFGELPSRDKLPSRYNAWIGVRFRDDDE